MSRRATFAWIVLALSLSACCCPCGVGPRFNLPVRQPIAAQPALPVEVNPEPIAKGPDQKPAKDDEVERGGKEEEIPVDPEPRLAFRLQPNRLTFGLAVVKDAKNNPITKLLTFSASGDTNDTMVRIDGQEFKFADASGAVLKRDVREGNRSITVWETRKVQISQILEIVPSKQAVEVSPGVRKRILDTCLVRFQIENKDNKNHTVDVRLLIDTLIGKNDGVPFAVPTMQGLVTTFKDFNTPEQVPQFIQALEIANLTMPGTVGHMTLKVGGDIEAPSRVSLTRWPPEVPPWEIPVANMQQDSAVALYWVTKRPLRPGEKRTVGFAYGLGQVSGGEGQGKLALTINGSFQSGGELTVTAYVQNPTPNQTLTLEPPKGFTVERGKTTEPVPAPMIGPAGRNTSTVNWTLRAGTSGEYQLRVRSSNGLTQTQPITIVRGRQ